jgi:hypothetical protein
LLCPAKNFKESFNPRNVPPNLGSVAPCFTRVGSTIDLLLPGLSASLLGNLAMISALGS